VRIALLGTRGIPANYGGFETFAEELSTRLVERGHQVIVYCRPAYVKTKDREYLGMRLVMLPSIRTKGLDTLSHSALSSARAVLGDHPDAAVVFGVGNAVFCRFLRWSRAGVAINVDGADWARLKWGPIGRRYLRWSERLAVRSADAVIADSIAVADYYRRQYRAETTFIPYGAEVPAKSGTATLAKFGLQPRDYLLAVGRTVPENGFQDLIEAYTSVPASMPLVIVGDAPYSEDYKRRLREMAPPSVIFTGYQFGDAYHELSAHACAFLFGAQVGGTHPVLVEQLAHGNCVLSRWTESNAEVAAGAAIYFHDVPELAGELRRILSDPSLVAAQRAKAAERARAYSWDEVTDRYEALLRDVRKRVGGTGNVDDE
jgi:glycosyltransferase involved in cell wall biosynthesis